MATYTYIGINARGNRVKGVATAASQVELEANLSSQGMAVLEIFAGGKVDEGKKGEEQAGRKGPRAKKVSRRDLVEFCIFIGSQLEAGVSLHTSLVGFVNETHHEWFRFVVEEVIHRVESGGNLSDSLELYPKVFDKEFVQLIRAGEKTGLLGRAFADVRQHLEWVENLMGSVKQATTYPVVVATVLFFFILYLFSFVIPKISKVLMDLKLDLPFITKIVFGFGKFTSMTWWIWVALFFVVPVAFRFAKRSYPKFEYWVDMKTLQLPGLGRLLSMILQSRFTHNFAVMHRAGISILENLELCSQLMGNKVFEKAIMDAREQVREGGRLTDSLRSAGIFSGLVMQMIYVGEMTGILDKSLQFAADYYDQEVPRILKQVFAVFEPMLIIFLVSLVGLVALSVFLPILSIGGGLRAHH